MIEAQNLRRRYGDFVAVDDVSFSIAPGEVVGLLGHNGAGKTTIMKMLTGFLEPSAGQVVVDGVQLDADPLGVQARLGYLPESLPLYPELTVTDYLVHAARLRSLDPGACVPRAVHATQLEAKAFDRIETLSRGYKQRLGVAQAILHEPDFLILDEPSNGLDPNQIQHMRDLIKEIASHATIILSTHIMQEVNAVCDRVMILRNGRLVVDEQLAALRASNQARLVTAPDAAVSELLEAVGGVRGSRSTAPGEWVLELADDSREAVAAAARALVEAGAPIYRLTPEARDLETVFAEVSDAA